MDVLLSQGIDTDRFWNKVKKSDGCWEWQACLSDFGYGLFRVNGKNVRAHRYSWEEKNGIVPDGMCVLHKCDNPQCVNPDHLFLGTKKDNAIDRVQKGRPGSPGPAIPQVGELHHHTKLKNNDILTIRGLYGKIKQREIARMFGITFSSVNLIIHNKRWGHLAAT